MRREPRKPHQLELPYPNTWGGKRRGAGRKVTPGRRPPVPHRARPLHSGRHPVHVTLRARGGLPPLRERGIFLEMRDAIGASLASPAVGGRFRVVEFSVQRDHVHLIVEATDTDHLGRGMRGLAIRLARAVNRALGVRGAVWADRYHARDLRTPREVRTAIVYVLMNAKKHLRARAPRLDSRSSAPWFTGFRDAPSPPELRALAAAAVGRPSLGVAPVASAHTWLGAIGWRRCGLLRIDEAPA